MLFKHTLHVEPFVSIRWISTCTCTYNECVSVWCRGVCVPGVCVCVLLVFFSHRRPFGTEQEFFVQLFVEYDESLKLPSVGDLLTKMFKEQKISFTEVF